MQFDISNNDINALYRQALSATGRNSGDRTANISAEELAQLRAVANRDGVITEKENQFLNAIQNKVNVAMVAATGSSSGVLVLDLEDSAQASTSLSVEQMRERYSYLASRGINYSNHQNADLQRLVTNDQITFNEFRNLVNASGPVITGGSLPGTVSNSNLSPTQVNQTTDLASRLHLNAGDTQGLFKLVNSKPELLESIRNHQISDSTVRALANYVREHDETNASANSLQALTTQDFQHISTLVDKFNGNHRNEIIQAMAMGISQPAQPGQMPDSRPKTQAERDFTFNLLNNADAGNVNEIINFTHTALGSNGTPILSAADLQVINGNPDLTRVIPRLRHQATAQSTTTIGTESMVDRNVATILHNFANSPLYNEVNALPPDRRAAFYSMLQIDGSNSNATAILTAFHDIDTLGISFQDIQGLIASQKANPRNDTADIFGAVQAYVIIKDTLHTFPPHLQNHSVVTRLNASAEALKNGTIRVDTNTARRLPNGAAAAYDKNNDVLLMPRGTTDFTSHLNRGIIVHELTHAGQDATRAGLNVYQAETEAFTAEGMYLASHGVGYNPASAGADPLSTAFMNLGQALNSNSPNAAAASTALYNTVSTHPHYITEARANPGNHLFNGVRRQ